MSATAAVGPSMAAIGPSTRAHPDVFKSRISFRDPNTPLFVAAATAVTSATGASAGAIYGTLKNDNPYRISARMGGTWFVASSTFFALREYIITPTLIQFRMTPHHGRMYTYLSEKQLGKLPAPPTHLDLTRGERQLSRMLDSGISGMIVGAMASWAVSGTKQISKGGFTGFGIAFLGQGLINSARLIKSEVFDPLPASSSSSSSPFVAPDYSAHSNVSKSAKSAESEYGSHGAGDSRWDKLQESTIRTLKGWSPITYAGPEQQLENFDRRQMWLEARLRKIEEEEMRIYERVKGAKAQIEKEDELKRIA